MSSNQKSAISNQKLPAPPDRGGVLTEQRNPASAGLDALSVEETLALINDEDAKVAGVVQQAIPAMSELVKVAVEKIRAGGRLIYLGAGTSGRLGVLDASECPPTFHSPPGMVIGIIAGGDSALRKSSEGAEDDPDGARAELERLAVGPNDVVVGIAAGGTTPYVLGGLSIAKSMSASTALIACITKLETRNSKLETDFLIALPTGPEILTGSTRMKAGTATKLALNMISTAIMVQLGKTWGNLMVDLRATNAKLRDRAARIITSQCDLSRDQALALLDKSDGRVKVALVMAKLNLPPAKAQEQLDLHAGQLRPLLGPPK